MCEIFIFLLSLSTGMLRQYLQIERDRYLPDPRNLQQ